MHASGDVKSFYGRLAAPVLIGVEATGNRQRFVELIQDLGHEIWIGDAEMEEGSGAGSGKWARGKGQRSFPRPALREVADL
jgi:hypothetical protein